MLQLLQELPGAFAAGSIDGSQLLRSFSQTESQMKQQECFTANRKQEEVVQGRVDKSKANNTNRRLVCVFFFYLFIYFFIHWEGKGERSDCFQILVFQSLRNYCWLWILDWKLPLLVYKIKQVQTFRFCEIEGFCRLPTMLNFTHFVKQYYTKEYIIQY